MLDGKERHMDEKKLLEDVFELALHNDLTYFG